MNNLTRFTFVWSGSADLVRPPKLCEGGQVGMIIATMSLAHSKNLTVRHANQKLNCFQDWQLSDENNT